MLVFLCFLGLFAQSFAEKLTLQGKCPQPKPISNFNETELIGEWYEWARTDNVYQYDHDCSILTYYRGDDGYIIEHYEALVRGSGGWYIWEGKMIPRAEEPTALYNKTFAKYSRDKYISSTYVAANLDHWVILYGCKEKRGKAYQFVWIWVKNYRLEENYQDEIDSALENMKLSMVNLSIVDQTNCPNHD